MAARSQLGLPTDQPIVLSGHQAQLWHPGILAKRFAAEHIARAHDAHAAWLVVDQDDNDPGALSFPAQPNGRWQRVDTTLIPKKHKPRPGTPTSLVPAFAPRASETPPASIVAERFDRALAALAEHAGAPSAAAQVTLATGDFLGHSVEPIFATDFVKSDAYRALVDEIAGDPDRCRGALNAAIAAHPRSGLRPLRDDELPLWTITDLGTRAVAKARGPQTHPLFPRGLLMTLFARLFLCDLFIHGTGGLAYEPVADDWLARWQPSSLDGLTPAPFMAITADLTLPLSREGVPTKQDVAEAAWLAHTARHAPGLVGDESTERTRRQLAARIDQRPRHHPDRDTLYRELHALLARHRSQHEPELTTLDDDLAHKRAAFRDRAVLTARDWPFVLYDDRALDGLHEAVAAEIMR